MTKRIYFAGIGGVGIGPLAMIAHDAGYDVTGSDQATSLMTEQLDSAGVAYTLTNPAATYGPSTPSSPLPGLSILPPCLMTTPSW